MNQAERDLIRKLFDHYMRKALDKRKQKSYNMKSGKQLFSKGKKK